MNGKRINNIQTSGAVSGENYVDMVPFPFWSGDDLTAITCLAITQAKYDPLHRRIFASLIPGTKIT